MLDRSMCNATTHVKHSGKGLINELIGIKDGFGRLKMKQGM